jgi:hypothetical protein
MRILRNCCLASLPGGNKGVKHRLRYGLENGLVQGRLKKEISHIQYHDVLSKIEHLNQNVVVLSVEHIRFTSNMHH